jgi:hypothetical protein
MQIDLIHRQNLGIAAAGRPTLYPKAGSKRGLAQADGDALADPSQGIAKPDRGGGLAIAVTSTSLPKGRDSRPAMKSIDSFALIGP